MVKDDAIAEMVARAWLWHLRLAATGKDATQFVASLAKYAAIHVRGGRKVCGQEKSKDARSPRAQQLKSFTVSPLPASSSLNGNIFDEALQDNTQTPVPDQVAFRNDFPAWRF